MSTVESGEGALSFWMAKFPHYFANLTPKRDRFSDFVLKAGPQNPLTQKPPRVGQTWQFIWLCGWGTVGI